MSDVGDERVHRGTASHLARWRAGERAGWKIGFNVPAVREQLGISERVVGHMVRPGILESGATYSLAGHTQALAEPEVAIHVGVEDGAIAGLGPAIEMVDVTLPFEDIEAILERNIFHRAAVLGAPVATAEVPERGVVTRNGEVVHDVDPRPATGDLGSIVALVQDTLTEHGEALQEGEVIICGIFAPPLEVSPGDEIAVDLGPLGRCSLRFIA
jgi:2-oxo-hept-3-ene-1,7-dioate hydratase